MKIEQPLGITVRYPRAGAVVVRPAGRIDLLTASELQRCLLDGVRSGRHLLVVDLGATEFLDSAGLSALYKGHTAAREAGGELRLARPSEQARTVLELTALDRVLAVYATPEAALSAPPYPAQQGEHGGDEAGGE
ncbi:MAG TPA: STAS domain-containing protein [Chloroflexota bacterium]|nr:STAS domain-containing protein [Chloroflexota bacterium]